MPDSVIARVADRLDIQPEQTDRVLRTLAQLIKKQSARDGRVRVPGLGVFQGEEDALSFEPDPTLAEAVNHRYAGLATVSLTLSPEFDEPEAAMETMEVSVAEPQNPLVDEAEAEETPEAPGAEISLDDETTVDEAPVIDEDVEGSPAEEEPVTEEEALDDEEPLAEEEPVAEEEAAEEEEPVMEGDTLSSDATVQGVDETLDLDDEGYESSTAALLDNHQGDGEDRSLGDPAGEDNASEEDADLTSDASDADPVLDEGEAEGEGEGEGEEEDIVAEVEYGLADAESMEDASDENRAFEGAEDMASEDATLLASDFDQTSEWAPPGSTWSQEDLDAILQEEAKAEEDAQPEDEYVPVAPAPWEKDEQEDPAPTAAESVADDLPPQPPRMARETPVQQEKRRQPVWPWILAIVGFLVIAGALYSVFGPSSTRPPNDDPTTAAVDTPPANGTEPAASDTEPAQAGADPATTDTTDAAPGATPDVEEPAVDTSPSEQQSNPAATVVPSTDGPIDRAQGGYTLVVASSTQRAVADDEATRYRRLIDDASIPVDVLHGESNGVIRYRVAVGQVATTDEALGLKERLSAHIPAGAWVTRILPDS